LIRASAARWSCRYRLSAVDVRDLLAERGVDVSGRTVLAWAHTFGPLSAAEARRHARPVGSRWYADETSVRLGAGGSGGYAPRRKTTSPSYLCEGH